MAGSAVFSRRHSAECMCQHCEAIGSGYFAQMALLSGTRYARDALSTRIAACLEQERRAAAMRSFRQRGRAPLIVLFFASVFLSVAGVVLLQRLAVKLAHVNQ